MRAAALALVVAGEAAAAVIDGGADRVERWDGGSAAPEFRRLEVPLEGARPANAVGADTFEAPHLFAFDETQNVVSETGIAVDVGADVPPGETVASHYVFFNPAGPTRLVGWVRFDAPILGVATSRANLDASDGLQATGVRYLSPGLRGLETHGGAWGDRVWIDPEDPFVLRVDLMASSPGDYVRVFTRRSPAFVRVPGADGPG